MRISKADRKWLRKQAKCPLCGCEALTLFVVCDESGAERLETEAYNCLCCHIKWPAEMQWPEFRDAAR